MKKKILYFFHVEKNDFPDNFQIFGHYERAKRTEFLLGIMYGLPRRHSNCSKTFKKIEKREMNFHDHLRTS